MDSYIKNIRAKLEKMKEGSRIEFEKWHLFVNQIIETHNNSISKFHGYIPQMLDEADGSLDMLVRKKLISQGKLAPNETNQQLDVSIKKAMEARAKFFGGRPKNNTSSKVFFYKDK